LSWNGFNEAANTTIQYNEEIKKKRKKKEEKKRGRLGAWKTGWEIIWISDLLNSAWGEQGCRAALHPQKFTTRGWGGLVNKASPRRFAAC